MKAVVAAFNQEKALGGAFSVITNLRMELFEALGAGEVVCRCQGPRGEQTPAYLGVRLQGFLLHSPARTRGHQVRLNPLICKLSGMESVRRITVTNWTVLH